MKKYLVLLLLFAAGFSLQAEQQGITVYFPWVTGTGSSPGDNDYFYALLLKELVTRNYIVTRTQQPTALILQADIQSHPIITNGESDLQHLTNQMFVLALTFQDSTADRTFIRRDLYYATPGEIDEQITLSFSFVPILPAYALEEGGLGIGGSGRGGSGRGTGDLPPDAWRNRQWYLGGFILWTPSIYSGAKTSTYLGNFGFGFTLDFQFDFDMALRTGMIFPTDWVVATDELPDLYFTDMVLEIPLSVQWNFKHSEKFVLSPFAGFNINISLLKETKPPPFAWKAGFQFCVKTGPGMMAFNAWFSMDIGKTGFEEDWAREIKYQRYKWFLGVGYKYGLGKVNEVRENRNEKDATIEPIH